MPIITLTTDFGTKDHSVGAVKGAILSEISDVVIIDITHQVSPFHISEAAYIIRNAYHNFPKGSIHIIGVDSELTPENKHLTFFLDGHYFICANNGIMSLIATEIKPEKVVEINIHKNIETNFTVLDIFVKVAAHIARGGTLEVIGKTCEKVKQLKDFTPLVNEKQNQIIGHIIYIDNFGNAISNINRKLFEQVGKSRKYTISARQSAFNKIYDTYSHAINFTVEKNKREEEGKKMAVFNSSNFLEIAIYKSNPLTVGGASSLLGLKHTNTITINFEE